MIRPSSHSKWHLWLSRRKSTLVFSMVIEIPIVALWSMMSSHLPKGKKKCETFHFFYYIKSITILWCKILMIKCCSWHITGTNFSWFRHHQRKVPCRQRITTSYMIRPICRQINFRFGHTSIHICKYNNHCFHCNFMIISDYIFQILQLVWHHQNSGRSTIRHQIVLPGVQLYAPRSTQSIGTESLLLVSSSLPFFRM